MAKKKETKASAPDSLPSNGRCKSCDAKVIWVWMVPSRTAMPIDPALQHGGIIEIRPNRKGDKLYGKVTGSDADQRKYISHFATCPNAAKHRKKTTRKRAS